MTGQQSKAGSDTVLIRYHYSSHHKKNQMKIDSIVLGGGCFWCLDAAYRLVTGVTGVVSGYAGGHTSVPTYEHVSMGRTGHAEVVEVTFDADVISLSEILDVFWLVHDPTTPNRQGNDVGSQYRSCIFFTTEFQRKIIERSVQKVTKLWPDPIVTEVFPLDMFYFAEEYHQDYFHKNPEAGYCQAVINPKLAKLREKAADKLRS